MEVSYLQSQSCPPPPTALTGSHVRDSRENFALHTLLAQYQGNSPSKWHAMGAQEVGREVGYITWLPSQQTHSHLSPCSYMHEGKCMPIWAHVTRTHVSVYSDMQHYTPTHIHIIWLFKHWEQRTHSWMVFEALCLKTEPKQYPLRMGLPTFPRHF